MRVALFSLRSKKYYLRAGRNLCPLCASQYQKVLLCLTLWRKAVCLDSSNPYFPSSPTTQKYLLKYPIGCATTYFKMQVGAKLGNLSLHSVAANVSLLSDFMPMGRERNMEAERLCNSCGTAMRNEVMNFQKYGMGLLLWTRMLLSKQLKSQVALPVWASTPYNQLR